MTNCFTILLAYCIEMADWISSIVEAHAALSINLTNYIIILIHSRRTRESILWIQIKVRLCFFAFLLPCLDMFRYVGGGEGDSCFLRCLCKKQTPEFVIVPVKRKYFTWIATKIYYGHFWCIWIGSWNLKDKSNGDNKNHEIRRKDIFSFSGNTIREMLLLANNICG